MEENTVLAVGIVGDSYIANFAPSVNNVESGAKIIGAVLKGLVEDAGLNPIELQSAFMTALMSETSDGV